MRILMLGNSYTSANHLPLMLAEMAGAEVIAHTRGGARLAEQLNPATKLGNKTLKALHDEKWDYVIVQEMSNGPITSKEKFMTNLSKLCGLIRENGAIPVLFATWAYEKNGKQLKKFGMEYEDMICSMKETFRETVKRTSCLLADVTTAFEQQAETVKLYAPDGSHPSEAGSKLAARTIAKVIWNDPKRKKEVS
ncbi:SGNH/GDSL hydrolase family protein [uncultured Dubosiella sp.]|uniref:SGNH/GDSL hydrolase family protein n=1 Tax=uncultured Dubosiella sp. TaxID=1937011 RepID=UPI0026275AF9|nr:SGNH/GDSL hydrolase family protein [uncultured Dubosiella sp.]